MSTIWKESQKWESNWWGECTNTYNEETKQYIYAQKMGLNEFKKDWYGRIGWDFGDKKILDVGGGPVSILLKSNAKQRTVVDPCKYPDWVGYRYAEANIFYLKKAFEDIDFKSQRKFDISFCYNVLQHVKNPQQVIEKMKKYSKEIRIFEWVNMPSEDGHPHILLEKDLNKWLKGQGKVERLNQYPCIGDAYFGIFPVK